MNEISGYQITQQICESKNSLIYRGYRKEDQLPVILKMLKDTYPSLERVAWYKREYEITRQLQIKGVIQAYELITKSTIIEGKIGYSDCLCIVLEDFGGESLSRLKLAGKLTISQFLKLGISLTEILGQIHSENVIHKDINPSNIIFNQATEEVKIIDFGIAALLSRENSTFKNVNILEGTVAYISPEQTGRMNRGIDYRTDFYSLGVTFYELLTGKLPFEGEDALSVVHCHIAKQLPPLERLTPNGENLPKVIAEIVMKLMAKNSEDRYQSAYGIQADLEQCLHQLQNLGQIEYFAIATQDISERFSIPQKLYGRENEIQTLLCAFERTAWGGSEILLISGYSGVGKTALVNEVHKPITAKRGTFIAGKYDQYQCNIPYFAISEAFNNFCEQILGDRQEILEEWKQKILTAIGSNGQVLIDVIPNLELIIGKQPSVPEVSSQEAQTRFNLVCEKFIEAICNRNHPLVLFLDDLQWADTASLTWIQEIITHPNTQYLLIIGAYRDNEVDQTHPLNLMIEDIRKNAGALSYIYLENLSQTHVNQIIAQTLNCSLKLCQKLTSIVYQKTGGNAFFTLEFLKELYNKSLLKFDKICRQWQWNIAQIEEMDITDNIIDLMISKICQLNVFSQVVLQLAACVGNTFDLGTLAIFYQNQFDKLLADLSPLLKEGLIVPLNDRYKWVQTGYYHQANQTKFKFQHDRVQQAAYSLQDDNQRKITHLEIGRLFLRNTQPEDLEDKVFDIVNQFNEGITLISDHKELIQLAELNLLAAKRAKLANAYTTAVKYLETAMILLPLDQWEAYYNLTFTLYLEAVECEYLSTNFSQANIFSEIALTQAQTILEKVKIYEHKIQFYVAQGKMKLALDLGLEVLNLLEIKLEQNFVEDAIFEKIDHLLTMENPQHIAAMRVLMGMVDPAYGLDFTLFKQIILTMLNLCITYGNCSISAYAYMSYSWLLCSEIKTIELGYQLSQKILTLPKEYSNNKLSYKIHQIYNSFIRPWKNHLNTTLTPLLDTFKTCLDSGNIESACFAIMYYCAYSFLTCEHLEILIKNQSLYLEIIIHLKREFPSNYGKIWRQLALNFQGKAENKFILKGEDFDENEILNQPKRKNNNSIYFTLYLAKLILAYSFNHCENALENADLASNYIQNAQGKIIITLYPFYYGLTLLKFYKQWDFKKKAEIMIKVEEFLEQLKNWSSYAPMNFQHKYYLMKAEKARVLKKINQAMSYYEKAIKTARKYNYLYEEALAYELAGEFYLSLKMEDIAQLYLSKAHYNYSHWQGLAKVEDLESRYPQFFRQRAGENIKDYTSAFLPIYSTITHTGSTLATQLDLTSVLKASQALSGEIKLEILLRKMMEIIMENAAAQKGYLILHSATKEEGKDDKWLIQAFGSIELEKIKVLQEIPIETLGKDGEIPILSNAIVNYVLRTQDSIVLNNAVYEGNFTRDPYILKYQPKSLLCTPLLNQGKLVGLLYLENNLITGAFTPDRLEILNLLSSQAAISLENAQLYLQLKEYSQSLEEKVQDRTAQLNEAKIAADQANQAKSEFLANMSHELRTPLNGILGYAQIFQRDQHITPKQRNGIDIIYQCGSHLLTLINDILDLSKIEARKLELYPNDFDFINFLNGVISMCRIKAEQKSIDFIYQIAQDLPTIINTDEKRLRQVLINLLSNGIKFTDHGHVTFKVKKMNLEDLSSDYSENYDLNTCFIYFEIEDTGVGMSPHQMERIFLPFEQVGEKEKRQEGTGLGLTITEKIVSLMGGKLEVKSIFNQGSRFFFSIPLVSAENSSFLTMREVHLKQIVGYKGERKKVLIVDDQADNRSMLVNLLKSIGFDVSEAKNGQEGLNKSMEILPDLILTDIAMPEITGLEMTHLLRQMEEFKKTVIIAISARVFESHQEKCKQAGCDDFIAKPIQVEMLFSLLEKHLKLEWLEQVIKEEKLMQEKEEEILIFPSEIELNLIAQAAEIGDFEEIKRQAQLLKKLNSQYISFANKLLELTKTYEDLEILALINNSAKN